MGNAIAKIAAIPQADLPLKSGRTSRSSSSRFLDSGVPNERIERLAPLRSPYWIPSPASIAKRLIFSRPSGCPKEELEELIVKKLRQCRVLFDFTKSLSDVAQKDIKRDTLLELVDFFVTERGFLTPLIYKEVFDMV